MATLVGEGINFKDVWNNYAGIILTEASLAHTYFWVYQNFYRHIYNRTENEKVRAVLFKLLVLYGIEKIIAYSQSFFETGVITSETLKTMQATREKLMKDLRP